MYPFIPQKSHDGCAIAVLTMVLNYFGNPTNYLNVEANFKDKNLNFKQLVIFLNQQNIKALPIFNHLKDLKEMDNFPLILHYQNHYVVAYQKVTDYLIIADPATLGLKKINILKVQKLWSGYYLDLSSNQINPIDNVEKRLPYNLRLFLINILILLVILLFI